MDLSAYPTKFLLSTNVSYNRNTSLKAVMFFILDLKNTSSRAFLVNQ